MAHWRKLERDGVGLSILDFGGDGPSVLFLHGLAGHAGEWSETASWLTADHRVLALEARGHGRSERRPQDLAPEAQIADVAFVLTEVADGPAALVGQSLGGVTAMLVAARHPELVSALVMADAAAGEGVTGGQAATAVGDGLGSWPVPVPSYQAVAEYFRVRFGARAAAV